MAAGAYKGLTIRIGADTSKLSSALRGANSAIYKTEAEFRKLSKAARIDPGNNVVATKQLGALANEAMSAAAKVETLNKAIAYSGKQESNSDPSRTIADLAAETENAALAAGNAQERYNTLTADIAHLSRAFDDLTGINLSKAVQESPEAYEEAKARLLELLEAANADDIKKFAKETGMSFDEAIAKIEELRGSWTEASNAFEDAKLVEALHNAEVEATAAEAQVNGLARSMAELDSKSRLSATDNIKDLDTKIKLASAATETAASRFERLDRAAKLNPMSIGTATEKAKALAEATEAARAKADALKQKIEAYKANGIEEQAKHIGNAALALERTREEYARQTTEVEKLKGALDAAQKALQNMVDTDVDETSEEFAEQRREVDELTESLKKAEAAQRGAFDEFNTAKGVNELNDLQAELDETTAKVKELGKAGGSGVSTAAVQAAVELGNIARDIGQHVVTSSNEVDSAYRNLRKTFNAEEDDYRRLYDAAMQYSQSHVTSADTMLDMEATAAQLGVGIEGGAKAIQSFADAAANLDIATDIDADTIALQMGQIMNVMDDVDYTNIDKFGDALVRLGNNMPTQESNIMQITQRLSAVGNIAGFSTPELMGLAAAVASTGQRSEAAATGIANLITGISQAVDAGGDDLEKYANVAGMSADAFANAWRDKPADALKAIIEGLGDSEKMFSDLADMDVNSVRQTQTLAALSQTVDNLGNAVTMADDAFNGIGDTWGDSGDAAREAERKSEGFSGSLAKLQNSAQVLGASFGDALVPWMDKAASVLQDLNKMFDGFGKGTKSAVASVGVLSAGFAVIQPVAAALFKHFASLGKSIVAFAVGGVGKLVASFSLASSGAWTLSESLALTGTGIGKMLVGFTKVKLAIDAMAVSSNAFLGVFGGVAVATFVDSMRQFVEMSMEAAKTDDVIKGLSDTTSGLSAELWTGKKSVDDYGTSWRDAVNDVDEFLSSMQEHNRVNQETRDEAVATIGELERYRDIIGEAAGKGSEFAGSELELKNAVEGLNDILGTNYSAADVLAGVYLDQNGAVQDLTTSIDELIAAKEREIRVSAMEDIYKEDFKAMAEAQNAYDKAAKARDDYYEKSKESLLGTQTVDKTTGDLVTLTESNWDKYGDAVVRASEGYRRLDQAANETMSVLGQTKESLDVTEKQWKGYADEMAYVESANFGVREGIVMTNSGITDAIVASGKWGDTLQDIQPKVGELSQGLQDAKVGAKEFAEMARDNPDALKDMFADAEGDVGKMVDAISAYNMEQLDEKYAIVEWDGEDAFETAEGDRYEWNGGEWEKKSIEVDDKASETAESIAAKFGSAMNEMNVHLGDLQMGLEDAGISTDQFMRLSSEQFEAVAKNAGGDVDAIVAAIAGINGIELDDKTMGFHFDEENNLLTAENKLAVFSNGEWTARADVEVDDAQVTEADQELDEVASKDREAKIKGEAETDEAESELDEVASKDREATITAKSTSDGDVVDTSKLKDTTVTVTVDVVGDDLAALTTSLEKLSTTPTTLNVTVSAEGADELADITSAINESASASTEIDVTINADTSALDDVKAVLGGVQSQVTTNVLVTADTAAVGGVIATLGTIPPQTDANVTVKAPGIESVTKSIGALNDTAGQVKDAKAAYTATGNAALSTTPKTNIQNLNNAVRGMQSKTVSANAGGTATQSGTADRIWATKRAIDNLYNKTVTVTTTYKTVGSPGKSASGAYVPYDHIPRHADGIFTRPTLTNIGWVGEDGAELYSGNSLVPLTNRKYSMPYINDISDAVARKLGPVGGGDTINITINGVSGPDETANAVARQLRLMGLAQGRR